MSSPSVAGGGGSGSGTSAGAGGPGGAGSGGASAPGTGGGAPTKPSRPTNGRWNKIREDFKKKPCTVCGATPSSPDHAYQWGNMARRFAGATKKQLALLENRTANLIPMCAAHNTMRGGQSYTQFMQDLAAKDPTRATPQLAQKLSDAYKNGKAAIESLAKFQGLM